MQRATLRSVRCLDQSRTALDASVLEAIVHGPGRHHATARLSARERDVIDLIATGRSNAGIANTLGVSIAAVERHVTSIFAKFSLYPEPANHRRVLAVLRYLESRPRYSSLT